MSLEQNLLETCIYWYCFFFFLTWKSYTGHSKWTTLKTLFKIGCYGRNQGREHTLKQCKLRKLRWTHGRLGYSKSMLEELLLIGIGGLAAFDEFSPLKVDLETHKLESLFDSKLGAMLTTEQIQKRYGSGKKQCSCCRSILPAAKIL